MPIRKASNLVASSQLSGGGGGGGTGSLLWEWNKTDVSQFSDGAGNPSSGYSSPVGTIAATTITSPDQDVYTQKVIAYSFSGGDSDAAAHFVINDLPTMPERFLVRAVIGPRDNGVGRWGEETDPGVIVGYQDATHYFRVSRATSDTTQFTLWCANNSDGINSFLYSGGPTTNNNQDGGALVEITAVLGEPDTGVDPNAFFHCNVLNGRTDATWVTYASTFSWGTIGSPPAMWHSSWQTGGSIRNVGLYFRELAAAGKGYVADLKIYEV